MICPHCNTGINTEWDINFVGKDKDGKWGILKGECPECGKIFLYLVEGDWYQGYNDLSVTRKKTLFLPKGVNRKPCPIEVPKSLADDYKEACLVLADSPKASAALSRRCLQNLLREKAGVKPGDLFNEIQEVLDSGKLPNYLAENIDAIRNIGNFSTHPIKSKNTGEIIDVEPGETEWNLDVLESLFDFYFVQPKILAEKRKKLDEKLNEAGKPPMK